MTRVPSFPVAGVHVGHVTRAGTGVTVLLFPAGSGRFGRGARRRARDARGRPARSRPFGRARRRASCLAGGSAFGLATADGVMRYLAERGQGFPTAGGPGPDRPGRVHLRSRRVGRRGPDRRRRVRGRGRRRPATTRSATGRVGAGTGATVGKWRGRDDAVAGRVRCRGARSSTGAPSPRSRS